MRKYKIPTLLMVLGLTLISNLKSAEAVSPIQKAENDYKYIMGHLRTIRITIENFGTDELRSDFENIKTLFQGATEEYYARNFVSSYLKYFKVKEDVAELLEKISLIYQERAKEILDSTSRQSFDILIKYSRDTALAKYFAKPYNPVEDIKIYDEEEYHFFHDNEIIESYLKNGYRNLENAKKIINDTDFLLIKQKNKKTSQNLNYLINKYIEVITFCRTAKMYGLEIHKILKINQLGKIMDKYNLTSKGLDPIFDDRIPEEYKVDANDNVDLIHSIELKKLSNR